MIEELSSVSEAGEQGAPFRIFGSGAAAPLRAAQRSCAKGSVAMVLRIALRIGAA
jgi:hypothetical protein